MSFLGGPVEDYGAKEQAGHSAKAYGARGVRDKTHGRVLGTRGMDQLASQYMGLLSGRGPSIAEMQAQQMYGQAMKGAMGMAAGSSASNRAGARRAAIMQGGELAGQAAGQGALARAQEQEMARQGFAGLIGGERGHQMGLEQLRAQNYATQMGALNQQEPGWGQPLMQLGGAAIGAAGSALGGYLGRG